MLAPRIASAADGTPLAARVLGEGPVVLLIHGFPGTSHSWRHQLPALAAAGYRAVAVDTRGYGASGRPVAPCYPSELIESDLLSVLDALGARSAHLIGHDFGSQYAWSLAQRHPTRVRSVLGTVPFQPPGDRRPSEVFAEIAERHFLHLHYFAEPGRAEADLGGANLAPFLARLFHALSARGDMLAVFAHATGTSYLDALPPAPPLPWPWLSEAEFATYLAQYAHGGAGRELAGGLASYRAADADWEAARRWAGRPITQPSLLVMGERDPVRTFAPPDLTAQRAHLTGLADVVSIAEAGHFAQQEQPAAFNDTMLGFLRGHGEPG